jgi:hypothetical protein
MADASVLRIRLMFSELVRDLDMAIAFYEAARPVRKNLHIAQYFGGTDAAATVATLRFAGGAPDNDGHAALVGWTP